MTAMITKAIDREILNMFWFHNNMNREDISINEIEKKNNQKNIFYRQINLNNIFE